MDESLSPVRLDIWLWAARFFRTRQLAKQAVDGGKVQVNGNDGKPAKAVRAGDRLNILREQERFEIEVLAVSDRRGPAPVAQALYRETEASIAAREVAREQRRITGGAAPKPPSRPDKRARRQLRGIDKGADKPLPPWFPK